MSVSVFLKLIHTTSKTELKPSGSSIIFSIDELFSPSKIGSKCQFTTDQITQFGIHWHSIFLVQQAQVTSSPYVPSTYCEQTDYTGVLFFS